MYQHEYNKEMSTKAVSQLVTSLLYYKRFFPYYVHCVVAGIDQDGMKSTLVVETIKKIIKMYSTVYLLLLYIW